MRRRPERDAAIAAAFTAVGSRTMRTLSKDAFVERIARSLDVPAPFIAGLAKPCECGSVHCEGWKVGRAPMADEIRAHGLESRFAMPGWRTALFSIIEE